MAGAAFFVRTLFMEDFIKKERRGCESKKTGRLQLLRSSVKEAA